jgi:hypothetical protein
VSPERPTLQPGDHYVGNMSFAAKTVGDKGPVANYYGDNSIVLQNYWVQVYF